MRAAIDDGAPVNSRTGPIRIRAATGVDVYETARRVKPYAAAEA